MFSDPNPSKYHCEEETLDKVLDSEFNMFELCVAIKKLSKNKSPGNDGIVNEVVRKPYIGNVEDYVNK